MVMHPLNGKERKELIAKLESYFGFTGEFPYVVFVSEDEKYYIATRDVEMILGEPIRIERIGVYFGQYAHGEFRLTIEGSQVIGPHAGKLVLELTRPQRDNWMLGNDVILGEDTALPQKFHIIRCGDDYLGCGKFKNGVLLNYVPKERYVGAVFEDEEVGTDESEKKAA